MPLASTFNLQWYGPASFGFNPDPEIEEATLVVRGAARTPAFAADGGGQEPALHVTKLKGNGFGVEAISEITLAPLHGSVRVTIGVDVGAQPSVQEIVAGVLDALALSYNKPNTIGARINASGAGGDPWADPRALTLAKFLGLK